MMRWRSWMRQDMVRMCAGWYRRFVVALWVCVSTWACLLSVAGCGPWTCTQKGCLDTIGIKLRLGDDWQLPYGVFQIQVTTKARGAALVECDLTQANFTGCGQPDLEQVSAHGTITASRHLDVRLAYFVRLQPEDPVQVRVWHDGTLVHDADHSPRYEEFYPNGRECDTYPCFQADISVDLTL